jgi:hypothetical protein
MALLLGALFLRILIPAGFMAGTVGGDPALILCPGADVSTALAIHRHHGGARHDPATHGDAPCPFAALAAPALPPAPPILAVIAAEPSTRATPDRRPATLRPGLAAPPPPSTGPPAFA